MADSVTPLLLICFALCFFYEARCIDQLAFVTPSLCLEQNSMFFPSNFTCVQCSSSQVPASDGLSCRCRPGYRRTVDRGTCAECAANEVQSSDGAFCVTCPTGSLPGTTTRQCQPVCNFRTLQAEVYSAGGASESVCVQCPNGLRGRQDQCVPCRLSSCACPRTSAGVCLSSSESTSFSFLSRTFSYYRNVYPSIRHPCLNDGNQTACQALRILCALDLYGRGSPACEDAPDVLYQESGQQLLSGEGIGDVFVTRNSAQGTEKLDILLAAYALNGSFLGFRSGTKELLLCPDAYIRAQESWPVGLSYQLRCALAMTDLRDRAAQSTFYSPYVRVGGTLYSVPVLVEGLRGDNDALVNTGADKALWRLARLFYLAESLSTEEASVSYASFMELVVEPRGGGLVYPPYLRVRYSSTAGLSSAQTVEVQFNVAYEGSVLAQQIALPVVVGVVVLLGFFYVGFKVFGFMRRSGRNFCQLPTLFFLVAECCSLAAGVIFLVLILATLYILVFFKSQIPLVFVLPTAIQEVIYIVLVAVGLICELIKVLHILWFQCTVDVFFVDWEKPKGQIITPDQANQTVESKALRAAPVSIWRTYFVANEWNELQSVRRGYPYLLLLTVLLLLEVISLGNIGNREPTTTVFYSATAYVPPPSRVLRFGLTTLIYSVLALLVRLYVLLFHERFVEHKLKQFVDLCSISNISVLVLSHMKYGQYVHGRSVHGFADTDMREMSSFFKKEEMNLVAKRGLSSDSDSQVYDAAFTDEFRQHFNAILSSATATPAQASEQEKKEAMIENRLRAYYNMNGFITSFIDKAIPDVGFVEQNKTLMEKALDFEFHDPSGRSILYTRTGTTFDAVLFYGQELHLFLLDLFVFTLVDMAAANFTLAAIVTFLLQWILSILRDGIGRWNLARKTLVDKRFLI